MSSNGNPLIADSNGDTIDRIYNHVEWLCLISDSDGMTHPGMTTSLQLVLSAIDSLESREERRQREKNKTRIV
ncbi:hypothetical protein SAMN04244573_03200 [Azotobacter beijerinckii]|uniref:Uncharacterized protein n=1 Tax=Azotobacter beijerinckii TaxID=170623 RepID=A0A1H9MN44_9GAMM|nr:hypothetical protein SAMN04244573_03200 [Azotobacter beijerinckii]